MPEKRSYPDQLQDAAHKRSKAPDGSPVAADKSGNAQNEAARKEAVAARIAAIKARSKAGLSATPPGGQPAAAPQTPPTDAASPTGIRPDVAARIAAIKAKAAAAKSSGALPPARPPAPAPRPADDDTRERVRAQIEALKGRHATGRPEPIIPASQNDQDPNDRARGGLGIGLHPALFQDLTHKTAQKGKAKKKNEPPANPYLTIPDAKPSPDERIPDESFDPTFAKQRDRKLRPMAFNQKGKFIAQAEAIRADERLEKLNKEIEAENRRREIEEATERSFLVKKPPAIEWWDEPLVNGSDYTDIATSPDKINLEPITHYIQHPVLLDPPQERNAPKPKAMYLTKKEQAKLRRQRRTEEHKEEQAKIRLGLVEPPPPKVKKSNLMRVLGQEAVKDPTAVEARVNREIEQRLRDHEDRNHTRQLTAEQRRERLAAQQAADAERGIHVVVFRVESICSRKHRFQIDKNAEQSALTGTVVLHPAMNLVVAEGGAHSIRFYKNLMMNRIRWAENESSSAVGEDKADHHEFLRPLQNNGSAKDLSHNKCTLVWEGENKERVFKRWRNVVCETDGQAKNALARAGMENMWSLAQNILN